ncbi:DUF2637 domain-containing protein [Streptomyces sp. V4-01]|uniref:DUF2637 domain-containing protein n=1 Tax=Actinacidiphila polyblastidii TaxID=3110430 RepID=A0ABU7P841_9ACTN|nr:DUF2637 domain-containing protein [Streptomyces sp. V4-01]
MAAIRLTRTHRILVGVVVAGAVVIAGIGFAGSYAAVRTLALHKGFGWFANVFPIGVDAGIVVLLSLDLLLTWLRIPFPLLRQTAWLLTAATIAFNGAAAWPDPLGVGMHAIIPVLFVVSVEAARHAIGRVADITADKHMESVRITRWVLAPVPTFRLWRRMKLWELRSYEEVIRREQDRLVYRARLRARFGVAWRRKAPIEAIMPLRLAKYGVPLSETADAGLAAAGIEVTPPVRQLDLAPATSAEPAQVPAVEQAVEQAAQPPQQDQEQPAAALTAAEPARPHPQLPQLPQMPQTPRPMPPLQQQPPLTQEQFAAQRQLYESYGAVPPEPWPHDSPWFAAQQQAQQYQQQAQAQQLMAPVGPYQERPLGYGALNGVNGNGNGNGVNGSGADGDAVNAAPLNGNGVPGPRQQPQHQPAQPQPQEPYAPQPAPAVPVVPVPVAAAVPAPEPEPEADFETYPVGGLELPEDVSPADAYFAAYRNYVQEHGTLPNTRQLARFLPTVYKGTPPEERQLVSAIRDLRYRYTSEANAESIP